MSHLSRRTGAGGLGVRSGRRLILLLTVFGQLAVSPARPDNNTTDDETATNCGGMVETLRAGLPAMASELARLQSNLDQQNSIPPSIQAHVELARFSIQHIGDILQGRITKSRVFEMAFCRKATEGSLGMIQQYLSAGEAPPELSAEPPVTVTPIDMKALVTQAGLDLTPAELSRRQVSVCSDGTVTLAPVDVSGPPPGEVLALE
jgi:hypothetical protein